MAASGNKDPDVRANAFDVLVHHNGRFLAAFYTLWGLLTALLGYARIATAENPPLAWPEIAIIIIVAAAVTVGIALPLSFGIVEGIPMVLAKLYTDRVRAEGREEGREEGRRERDQLWEAWNKRRLEAERGGLPFTEPTPSRNGTQSEDAG